MSIKKQLLEQCGDLVGMRLRLLQNSILDIENSLNSETKSSAGDKHETGRAMIQLEREKLGNQLRIVEEQRNILKRIRIDKTNHTVALGSIVTTNKANYFISISAGKISADGISYYAISLNTPIGQLLFSKRVGETVIFRDETQEIIKIL
ncbi:3-oxoacyl-ACP synthase [Winogradskyella aurantiaca]|uniref:3-oxoacyl-ACP synthase n=1 Tax=Winogradskyella aurantiaca TaxID=2219558 RepID=UPI000E1C5A13|nr:3-oxoacyl-ACP synthase [Winogradskyella aurantiaca]